MVTRQPRPNEPDGPVFGGPVAIRIKRKQSSREPGGMGSTRRRLAEKSLADLRSGGNKSFKQTLRKLFNDSGSKSKIISNKDQMLKVALDKAKKGDFFFWNRLIDLHESDAVTRDDVAEFVERIYQIVRRNVEGLDGGPIAMANIARDLQKDIQLT